MDNLENLNKSKNLIWIDLEMTGLDTQSDNIIEIATIVTNHDLEIIAEGPEIAINQPKIIMDEMITKRAPTKVFIDGTSSHIR